MKSIHFLVAALAVGLIAAGCGGGDDDGGDRLTQEEFVAEADKFCAEAEQKFTDITNDLQQKVKDDPAAIQTAIEDALKQFVPVLRDAVNQIGELNPPEELQSKLDDFVAKANEAADQVETDPKKFAQEASQQGSNPFPEVQQLSTDLGLQNCGPDT